MLHSVGSFGIVTLNLAVHVVFAANVLPLDWPSMTTAVGNVQVIGTAGPLPGLPVVMNGACSVSPSLWQERALVDENSSTRYDVTDRVRVVHRSRWTVLGC